MEREGHDYQSNLIVVAYEPGFDRSAYQVVEEKDKERLNAYTKTQLETHLGERLNVLLSKTRYEIRDGQIFGENTTEPFIKMLKRGRDYRRKHGNSVDFAREDAEVVGFESVLELARESASIGEAKISISQRGDINKGSIYDHNFYDIFTLREDGKGRYIEARRYSSSLILEETARRLKEADLIASNFEATPEHFLANPIDVPLDNFATADDLHKYLHKDHDYVKEEEFEEVKRMTAFLVVSIINGLLEKPINERDQLLGINAYLNAGDIALNIIRGKNNQFADQTFAFQQAFGSKESIYTLGMQPVRVVATGCGASGGFSVNGFNQQISSPFSVSEFSKKGTNQEWFNCPKCSYKADGPVGNRCPGCGLTKEQFAEQGGKACD
jgi:hypothetical protein